MVSNVIKTFFYCFINFGIYIQFLKLNCFENSINDGDAKFKLY